MRPRRLFDVVDMLVGLASAFLFGALLCSVLRRNPAFYKRSTDWGVYIFHGADADADADTPKASSTAFGKELVVKPVGRCIKGSPCYDLPDTNLQNPFIFSFHCETPNPMINGYSVPEGLNGVFVFNEGEWKPLEEFDGLVHPWSKPTEEQPINTYMVMLDGASEDKDFILEYQMAPSTALLEKGPLQTTDYRIGELGMTLSHLRHVSFICQPAVPPGYMLMRLKVLDGDETIVDTEVDHEKLRFVMRIREGSSHICYGRWCEDEDPY